MAKVCPKTVNFATAETIVQLSALRPHPNDYYVVNDDINNDNQETATTTMMASTARIMTTTKTMPANTNRNKQLENDNFNVTK